MKLSKSCDFALRVLVCLGSECDGGATMHMLAEKLDISYHHLTKIIQKLAHANIVLTRQGKNGGVQLIQVPDEITLKRVVEVMDGPARFAECFASADHCRLERFCKIKAVLHGVQDRFDGVLQATTVAQMI